MKKFSSHNFCSKRVLTGIALLGLTGLGQVCFADDIDDIQKAEELLLQEENNLKNSIIEDEVKADNDEKELDESIDKKNVVIPKTVNAPQNNLKKFSPEQEIVSLKSQIDLQGRTNRKIKTENEILRDQLTKSQEQVKQLMAKVSKLRNELMIAETEVERLNLLTRGESRSNIFGKSIAKNKVVKRPDPLLTEEQAQKTSEEMPIATVLVDKANLRAGPGLANSPIMSVNKGTRLSVETRSGDWYRVVAPTGERAWISSDTVAFGRDSRSAPSRTVREQGGNQNFDVEEDAALELIKAGKTD